MSSNDEALILSGRVSSTAVMLKAGEIATASASKAKVMNLLQLPGASSSQQVMLQVRFAEVNRKAVQELGVNFFMGPNGQNNYAGRMTTGQFAAPVFDEGKTHLQRLPEPVRAQHELQRGRGHQGARRARGTSRAWPNRT